VFVAASRNKKSASAASVRPELLLGMFGAAIFLSAGLLFAVQPLFTKIVLPTLGGAPAVWSVALVFFQGALLAGYLYAHLLTRHLPGRQSVIIHLIVMIAATLALPLGIATGWGRPPAGGAELWLIGLFAVSIGLPFFALSANAPLLQAWFARTGHPSARDPYFLYAASNVGSFLALLSYPFLVEPFSRLGQQTTTWSILFFLLIAMIAVCGVLLLRSRNALPAQKSDTVEEGDPRWRDAAIWVGLAAVPSAFLIAVTAHISTDIAAAPLLWVVPLALYLLTFVIVFQTKRIISHQVFLKSQPAVTALLIGMLIVPYWTNISLIAAINFGAFFVTAMVCHGELARRRPDARHLTAFYLWIAVGGMIGGIFTGLLAPYLFNWVAEYPLLIVAGILCRPGLRIRRSAGSWTLIAGMMLVAILAIVAFHYLRIWPDRTAFDGMVGVALVLAITFLWSDPLKLAAAFACVLVVIYGYLGAGANERTIRSFFGVHKIYDVSTIDSTVRVLMHGTTIHGGQIVDGPHARTPEGRPSTATYFGPRSPMARVFDATKANKAGPIRVAVVGLGAGTVACFVRPQDTLHFYEIDQTVVRIALDTRNFDYVAKCKPDSRVTVGDARLTLEDAQDAYYDLIVMDAFTSDAVPVHLLTREAMALYLKKLAPGGMVVSHVMNRHLELPTVVAGIAASNGLVTRYFHSSEYDNDRYLFASSVAAVARSDKDFGALLASGEWEIVAPDPTQWVWTDDYSNIVGALLRHMRQ
jgi:hypothetical protein